jgi:hypothetical protein
LHWEIVVRMYKISVIKNLADIDSIQVFETLDSLLQGITEVDYCCGLFEGVRRHARAYRGATVAALDIDGSCSISAAISIFENSGLRFAIATTRNHQKPKNGGEPRDRFRVLIPLEQPISGIESHELVYGYLHDKFRFVDQACKDASRLYYRSVECIYISISGAPLSKEHYGSWKERKKPSPAALKFLSEGYDGSDWHKQIYETSRTLRANGYSRQEVTELILQVSHRFYNGKGFLDDHDISTLEDAFCRPLKEQSQENPPKKLETQSRPALVDSFTEQEEQIARSRERYESYLTEGKGFLCAELEAREKYLVNGITLIGAQSGHGKSTLMGPMIARYLETDISEDRKALIISNEDTEYHCYSRVSASLLGKDFKQLIASPRLAGVRQDSLNKAQEILKKRFKIIGPGHNLYGTTNVEDMLHVIKSASQSHEFGCVFVDYYQEVVDSSCPSQNASPLKRFGRGLKNIASATNIPIVIFAQLKTNSDSYPEKFKNRIEGDKHIFNHAAEVMELIYNPEHNYSTLINVKSRFGDKMRSPFHFRIENGTILEYFPGPMEVPSGF